MSDTSAEASHLQVFIHGDDETPSDFVVDLLHSVFKIPFAKADNLAETTDRYGQALCGTYSRDAADEVLVTARQRIQAAGHPLLITTEAVTAEDAGKRGCCKVCGAFSNSNLRSLIAIVCDDCIQEVRSKLAEEAPDEHFDFACEALGWFFVGIARDQLVATSRQFPGHMRADVQIALDKMFSESPIRFFGIHERQRYETLSIAALSRDGHDTPGIAPAQYHDVDVGDSSPVKCLQNGLWLCEAEGLRYAVLLSSHREYSRESGIRVEIVLAAGAAGAEFVRQCFSELASAVNAARCYRGKILSLDRESDYRGSSKGIMVHKLAAVQREDVILPEATLKLLDRNVISFVGRRAQLRQLGQSCRKGILLYGPPGTGKTHTIRYLASNLPGHTTIIMTAAQIAMLDQYMDLARLLQPSMVVIEDVDLIASDRNEMGPCEEALLNDLLNQMDGLKEDADILFVLTTNRPETLESALAGRPGRIDQAIEVPLPDEIGRSKLVKLYGSALPLGEAVVAEAAQRTNGVSAAFIKEMMRRIAQASIVRDGGATVESEDISEALDDMLVVGGRLNTRLLGGAQEMAGATISASDKVAKANAKRRR
jgi:ATP-dependent Clp protease adapter protein ClpS